MRPKCKKDNIRDSGDATRVNIDILFGVRLAISKQPGVELFKFFIFSLNLYVIIILKHIYSNVWTNTFPLHFFFNVLRFFYNFVFKMCSL